MKNKILKIFMSVMMTCMFLSTASFANNESKESIMSSKDFLDKKNENKVITLNENIILNDSLYIDEDYTVDLNGYTLRLTKADNYLVNNADVIFKNGTINLNEIKGNADCIIGIGNYSRKANLTLDKVELCADNYKSPYALIYVYNDSILNIQNSILNVKNEKSLSGGVIKASNKTSSKINIIDSKLNFENTVRGFVDGTINIKNSSVSMNGLSNGINSSNEGLNLIVDNSDITITGCIGRALTIDKSNVEILNNSLINFSKSLDKDIKFNDKGIIKVDSTSKLNFKTINLTDKVKDIDLNQLIISERYNYEADNKGNITKLCNHIDKEIINEKSPTCTEEGYTGDTACSDADCNSIIEYGTSTPQLSHEFEDGTCKNCDETQIGWVFIDGKWYYNKADGNKAIGWLEDKEKWYYFNNVGEMQIGWLNLGNTWYYLNQTGEMATGWKLVEEKWYYFNNVGEMQIGWLNLGNTWYYLNQTGEMATGWKLVEGKWYYLDNNGAMYTGWINLSGTWYYLKDNGEMSIGWEFIDGVWYYMYSSGAMATNVVIEGWKIDSNGVATPNK